MVNSDAFDNPLALARQSGAIIYCVLFGVLFIPTVVIGGISLAQVPAGPLKDPLRGPFVWLRSAFSVFSLFLLTIVFYIIFFLVLPTSYSSSFYKPGLYFNAFEVFFYHLTLIVVNITLLFVVLAFLHLVEGETQFHKFAKIAGLVVTFIVLVLDVAYWGVLLHAYSSWDIYYGGDIDPAAIKCIHAVVFLSWILSLAIAGLAVIAFTKTKIRTDLGNLPQLLLGANLVWLIHTTYTTALVIKAYVSDYTNGEYLAQTILDPIFTAWTTFVVLVLLFVIGKRHVGGLWPQGQQFPSQQPMIMGGAPVMGQVIYANQVPAGYVPYNMPQQPQQPQYAYVQPSMQPMQPVQQYNYTQPQVIQSGDMGGNAISPPNAHPGQAPEVSHVK